MEGFYNVQMNLTRFCAAVFAETSAPSGSGLHGNRAEEKNIAKRPAFSFASMQTNFHRQNSRQTNFHQKLAKICVAPKRPVW
jgi:hypothetical protein